MKKIEVEIKGMTPLLMNSPKAMIDEMTKSTRKTTVKYNPKEEAEKLTYKKENGELYVPAEAIKGCLVGASSYKKFGRYSARPIIAGGVIISPRQVGLGTKKYDIDLRTVVIQRNRVVKARPMINEWKLKFIIEYDDSLIASGDMIKPILEEAGKRVGLLDFRPAKLGNFGMFEIVSWKEID